MDTYYKREKQPRFLLGWMVTCRSTLYDNFKLDTRTQHRSILNATRTRWIKCILALTSFHIKQLRLRRRANDIKIADHGDLTATHWTKITTIYCKMVIKQDQTTCIHTLFVVYQLLHSRNHLSVEVILISPKKGRISLNTLLADTKLLTSLNHLQG